MVSKTYSAVVFVIACFLSSASGAAPAQHNEPVTAKWRVDIHAAIGGTPLPVVWGRIQEYKGRPRTSLWFTDNNTIVATFVTREGKGNPKVSRRDASDESLPLRLRAVFLDAATGKITNTTDWPSQSRYAAIVATRDGKFVAQTGDELTLYGSAFGALKKLKLPAQEKYDWQAYPSATGKNILFLSTKFHFLSTELRSGTWLWVETDSLQILHSWEDTQSGDVTISDGKIAMVACKWISSCEPKVEIKSLSTGWATIAQSDRRLVPHFVGEEMLFLTGNATSMIRTDGKIVFAEDGPSRVCFGASAFVSLDGQRLVVPTCRLEGQVAALDIGGHGVLKTILVYDVSLHAKSHTLEVKGQKIKDEMQFAMSPDGSKLAVLSNEFVQVFQLPDLP
jgi:hypothetical protein